MRLNQGLEAGALLVQGVLAGLTLASVYIVFTAEDLESFIVAYEVWLKLESSFRLVLHASLLCPRGRQATDHLAIGRAVKQVTVKLGSFG